MKPIEPRMWFGYGVLLSNVALALVISLGKVKQEDSYGLEIVLGSLATLSGAFSQWAFSKPHEKENKNEPSIDINSAEGAAK